MKDLMIAQQEKEQKEKLIVILAIGVLTSLKEERLNDNDAQRLIFSPHLCSLIKKEKIRKGVVRIIELGCELEDIKDLNLGYKNAIEDILKMCLEILGEMEEIEPDIKRWYSKIIE